MISNMSQSPRELLQGTLDMLILKTLDTMGTQHGFGIARRIEQVSDQAVALNHGTVYPALLRLEQQGLISSEWSVSDNNRRARFYSITKAGRRRLADEIDYWRHMSTVVNTILNAPAS